MSFRRNMKWTRVVIGALFAISTASAAFAQAPPARRAPARKGPAVVRDAGAESRRHRIDPPRMPRTCKSVLFNWTWYLGMLRGVDEHELIVSLEYQGKGTVQVDGQPCTLTKYRVSTNYQTARSAHAVSRARAPTARRYSAIEVVSGPYAWNEDVMGAEIVGTARGRRRRWPPPRRSG